MNGDAPVLADYDAIRIGVNFDGTTDGTGGYRVLVVVEADQAGLRDRSRHRVEAVEPAGIRNELRSLRLEHFPDRLLSQLRMAMYLGVTPVELVSFSRSKAERDVGCSRHLPMLLGPLPGITAHSIVTTVIAAFT